MARHLWIRTGLARYTVSRGRRLALGAAICTSLAVLAAAILIVMVRVQHPRDERTFLRTVAHVSAHGGRLHGTNDGFLIAEGDRACHWLQRQPPALWRRGGQWSFQSLRLRYLRDVPASAQDWSFGDHGPRYNRDTVATEAWARLCGASYYLRKTHNPLTRPSTD